MNFPMCLAQAADSRLQLVITVIGSLTTLGAIALTWFLRELSNARKRRETEEKLRKLEEEKRKTVEIQKAIDDSDRAAATHSENVLKEKFSSAKAPDPQAWSSFVRSQFRETAATAREMTVGTRVIVVISGKGGVGKSTISLGISEYLSRHDSVLLVDFDLPNRGLTSLLEGQFSDEDKPTNLLAEIVRFRQLFSQTRFSSKGKETGQANTAELSAVEALDEFRKLRSLFMYKDKDKDGFVATRTMGVNTFHGDPVVPAGDRDSVKPENIHFLPSVKKGDLFLSSKAFDASFKEVFYFIRCLAHWAKETQAIGTIVLDCHGAHDMYMVGAIHSATHLVIATTPEPGSFDGTYDLIAFAKSLEENNETVSFPSVLTINNCRSYQQNVRQAMEKFFSEDSKVKPNTVVGIDSTDSIRDVMSNYFPGKVSQTEMWPAISTICKAFGAFRSKDYSNLEVEPPPSPASATAQAKDPDKDAPSSPPRS